MFAIYIEGLAPIEVSNGFIWTSLAVWLAITLTFYALRSIGLYVMAKKQGFRFKWMAFLPCVWIFVACRLVGETRLFNTTFKKIAVAVTIIFTLGELLYLAYNLIIYFPVIGNFFLGGKVVINLGEDTAISGLEPIISGFPFYVESNPYLVAGISEKALVLVLDVIDIVSSILSLISTVVVIIIYINLFKKYWPQHFILAAVLSWLGIFAPLVFAVRNKEPVDYNEYLNQRYNGWYTNNGNPYRNNNFYQNNGSANEHRQSSDPFEEFQDKNKDPGNPFSEFDDKK